MFRGTINLLAFWLVRDLSQGSIRFPPGCCCLGFLSRVRCVEHYSATIPQLADIHRILCVLPKHGASRTIDVSVKHWMHLGVFHFNGRLNTPTRYYEFAETNMYCA